jgi:hypothetical protein
MARLVSSSHSSISIALLILAAPSLAGCFPLGGTNPKELRRAAAALIPADSRVIKQSDGDCVEFERSPSCRLIYFLGPLHPTGALASEVQRMASAHGWSLARKDVYAGGTELRLKKAGLRAYVSLAAGARVDACRRRPREDCASLIDVSAD